MSPRAMGGLCVVIASALACAFAGESRLAFIFIGLALVASFDSMGGLRWLLGVPLSLAALAAGFIPIPLAAMLCALSVVSAGLAGPAGLSVVGVALVLALTVAEVRGVRFIVPLLLSGVGIPLLLMGQQTRRFTVAWRPWMATVAVCVVVSGLGFALVPRLGVAVRQGPALTGFQARVDLDDASDLLDDPTPIARIEVVRGRVALPARLRGVALQHFDGFRWTAPAERSPAPMGLDPLSPHLSIIPLGRIDEGAVFGLGFINGASIPTDVDAAGNRWGGALASEPYVVSLGERSSAPIRDGRWLSVPQSLDPRIPRLAAEWASTETAPARVAERFVGYLRDTALYTRHPPATGVIDPLSDFLFGARAGHCEHWATALTVLLRLRGVPARPVNGFVDLEADGDGFVVRRSHAHAWVEVRVGDAWVVYDPTPGPGTLPEPPAPSITERVDQMWESDVIGYDSVRQRQAARTVVRGLASRPWTLAGLYGLLMAMLAWRVLRIGDATAMGSYTWVLRTLKRQNMSPPVGLPPVDAAKWVVAQLGPEAESVEQLAWHVYAVRYGGQPEAIHGPRARVLARELQRNLPRLCAQRRSR
ncbi:MAG: transglutaminase-like putative cysteine protease [Myxococcota bacterium]|jgi:transglutaminase-like putative cysteine protease